MSRADRMRFANAARPPSQHRKGCLLWSLSLASALIHLTFAPPTRAQNPPPVPTRDDSYRHEIQRAIDRGLDWLRTHQNTEGWWSSPDHPALTALPLMAFQGDPASRFQSTNTPWLEKAYAYLRGNRQPDGGLHRKQLANYNTALSLLALLGGKNPKDDPLILNARQFLIRSQIDFGEPGKSDTPFDGGIGYGSSYEHSDMANPLPALEALYYSRTLARDQDQTGFKDLNWAAALHFIQSCQNLKSHNKESWASDDPAHKGGFVYYPGLSKAGSETNAATGRVALRSYASISYAGLLSYIYAQLDKQDPRVTAVVEWLQRNYTLDENPGLEAQGLFYYFHTMAKALTALGADQLTLADGRIINWRRELAERLLNLQKRDGSWLNEAHARWWERDPVLVTSYAVLTLEFLHRGL